MGTFFPFFLKLILCVVRLQSLICHWQLVFLLTAEPSKFRFPPLIGPQLALLLALKQQFFVGAREVKRRPDRSLSASSRRSFLIRFCNNSLFLLLRMNFVSRYFLGWSSNGGGRQKE